MNRKVRALISQYSMLEQGDTVTAAVSGGADSVALLDLLCSMQDLQLSVRVCHVNHCLRGPESDRDEQLVRTMCREYGVPVDVKRIAVEPLAKERRQSIELTAREERYRWFQELIERNGGKLATAHTLSDTAETVLFNMARGTGLSGICGIPSIRGRIIRPLISCSRQEVEEYCAQHDLYYVTDSTNLSDDYTRNFIRHQVLPRLSEVNAGALRSIGRMTEILREDADYLDGCAAEAWKECICGQGLDIERLSGLHPALRSRVVGMLLAQNQVERTAERIAGVVHLCQTGSGKLSVSAGKYALAEDGVLAVCGELPPQKPQRERRYQKKYIKNRKIRLDSGKELFFSVINCIDYEIFKNNPPIDLKYAADYDKINADIILRSRRAGDRMKPVGRGVTKTLKKLFCEAALGDRERLAVLADEAGVLFAEGIGVDDRVRLTAETRRVLAIEVLMEGQK